MAITKKAPNFVHYSKREKISVSNSAIGKSLKITPCQLPLAMVQLGLLGGIPQVVAGLACEHLPVLTSYITHRIATVDA